MRCVFHDTPNAGGGVFKAVSTDGIHYIKDSKPLIPHAGDCTVFPDEATGLFHLVTGDDQGLRDYVSSDLANWQKQEKVFFAGNGCCPHHFKWNDWYYFVLNHGFSKSRNPAGPWTALQPTYVSQIAFPKTAAFTGNRRLMAGWLPDGGWGGDTVVLEMVQNVDGSLGTKFVPEMIPNAGERIHLSMKPLRGDVSGDERNLGVKARGGFAAGMLADVPQNVRITMRLNPASGTSQFGVRVRGSGSYEKGAELQFDPGAQRMQIGSPKCEEPSHDETPANRRNTWPATLPLRLKGSVLRT